MTLHKTYNDSDREVDPIHYLHRCNMHEECLRELVSLGLNIHKVDNEYNKNVLEHEITWGRGLGFDTFRFFYLLGVEIPENVLNSNNYKNSEYYKLVGDVQKLMDNQEDIKIDARLDIEKINLVIQGLNLNNKIDEDDLSSKFKELEEKFKILSELSTKNKIDLDNIDKYNDIKELGKETLNLNLEIN